MDNHIFRTAMMGFNRQDVIDYIEKEQKRAAERAADLAKEAETLRQALDETRSALETSDAALGACREELDGQKKLSEQLTLERGHARNNWDAQVMANAALREDMARREADVRALTEEKAVLTDRVAELEGRLEGLRRDKERITQLELDAHQRSDDILAEAEKQAKVIETAAQAQAAATCSEAEQQAAAILAKAQEQAQTLLQAAEERIAGTAGQCDALHQSVENSTSHISDELKKLDVTTKQLPVTFRELKDGLAELLRRAKER